MRLAECLLGDHLEQLESHCAARAQYSPCQPVATEHTHGAGATGSAPHPGGADPRGWALTVYQARTMDMPTATGMAGMATEGWTWDGFATFFLPWAMMAAMMFPAAAPMLLLFRTVAVQRRGHGAGVTATWIFATGYLLVWAAIGAVVWALVEVGSDLAGSLGSATRAMWGPPALGAVLMLAVLYQLTPLKRVCLDQCRTPLGFVTHHWRDGSRGALRMGSSMVPTA